MIGSYGIRILATDTQILDYLESRGVVSVSLANGEQINPGSQSLRAAFSDLVHTHNSWPIERLCDGDRLL